MFNISNLSDEEYIRLNNVTDERFLDWYDELIKLRQLKMDLMDSDFIIHENLLDDLYYSLSIKGYFDENIDNQFKDIKARLESNRECYENDIIKSYLEE